MSADVPVSKTLSISDCGYGEIWLQDRIWEAPRILGLGADLEPAHREKHQTSGGWLDILLIDRKRDTMYEVEVMLGPTDESHIIRTIEYWDLERRHWPKRKHCAVLVAERITKRFFNVIRLLSDVVPIIAIQANLIEANGARILHFATILDAYEEPEDEPHPPVEVCDESRWRNQSSSTAATLDTVKALLRIVSPVYGGMELGYTRSYIALRKEADFFNQFSLKRRGIESTVSFCVNDSDVDPVSGAFGQKGLVFTREEGSRGKTEFSVVLDQVRVERNADLFRTLAEFVKKCKKP